MKISEYYATHTILNMIYIQMCASYIFLTILHLSIVKLPLQKLLSL